MSDRQHELAEKRRTLLAETDVQRERLTDLAFDIEQRLAGIDRSIHIMRTISKRPVLVAGAVAVIALIGPRRLLRAVTRGAALIASGRQISKLLRG